MTTKPPVYAVDFESYYDKHINIDELGLNKYVKTADIYLVAIVGPGMRYVGHPKDAPWSSMQGDWVSHNAGFDRACWRQLVKHNYVPWNDLFMGNDWHTSKHKWHCTSSMSVYLRAGRSLKSAAKNLLGKEVSKDVRKEMKGKTVEMMAQIFVESQGKVNFYDEVCEYALHDAELCWELWDQYGDQFPEFERWLANHTYEICAKGIPVDLPAAESAKSKLELMIFNAKKQLPWCTGGEDDVALSPKLLKAECLKNGIPAPESMAQDSPECDEWLAKYADTYPFVLAMRTVRRANMLLKKVEILLERTVGTRFNFGFKYYGAHTGRWSGDSGFNVQNMNKEPFDGFDLRQLIRAEPGFKLVIADLAQIEARVAFWLAGDEEMLAYIKKGVSIYQAHAVMTMGWHEAQELKKVDKRKYLLAKARILALNFGVGAIKFQKMAALLDIILTDDECIRTVSDYREKNKKIVGLWKVLLGDMKMCLGHDYDLILPSGRRLIYFDVHYGPGKIRSNGIQNSNDLLATKEKGSPAYENWYGGKLFENAVQATARDIFAHAFKNVVDAGYEVIFHSHDELIAHVPVNVDKSEIERLMTTNLPPWAYDFPLGVESVESQVYLK